MTQDLRAYFTHMTPKKAAKLLESNTKNRSISKNTLASYAADLRAGRWRVNGETIKISSEGRLLDGQHRLMAIVETETPADVLIVEGLEESVFDTIDIGVKRTAGQIMGLAGHINANMLAAVGGWFVRIEDVSSGATYRNVVSAATLADYVEKYNCITWYAGCGKYGKHPRHIRAPVLGVLAFASTVYGQVTTDEFLDQLVSGENLSTGDPAFALRERLLRNSTGLQKLSAHIVAAISIKSINAFASGARIAQLKWSPSKNEEWPRIMRKPS